MADHPLTTTDIKRKKRTQSKISQTTGALGLAGLGAFTASKLPGSKVLTKTPTLRRIGASRTLNRINPKKAENAALGASVAGGGIGGIGSFNFAQYTRAEAEKGKKVKKDHSPSPFEDGYYGSEGISKALSDKNRDRAALASAAGAGALGVEAVRRGRKAVRTGAAIKDFTGYNAIPVGRTLKTGAAGAGAIGAAYGAKKLQGKRKDKSYTWQPVAKSSHSAFGVVDD